MTSADRKDVFLRHNSLACYLELTVGQRVTVELRNESSVSGVLESVDGYMNVQLKDAVFITARGSRKRFDDFQVSGRQVRFVQLPPDVRPGEALKKYFETSNAARLRAKVDSFKSSKSPRLLVETRLFRDELRSQKGSVKAGGGNSDETKSSAN